MTGPLVWIGVGVLGAAGAFARFAVGTAITARRPTTFPWGTLVVNLTGGFALGALTGLGLGDDVLLVLGTGFLGGYTTFSTWMVEAQRLGEDGDFLRMTTYLLGSMLAGLLATGGGWALTGAIP